MIKPIFIDFEASAINGFSKEFINKNVVDATEVARKLSDDFKGKNYLRG